MGYILQESKLTIATELTAATSFCKCTCFGNSTIIQLDGNSRASTPAKPVPHGDTKTGHGTCLDCNKKFCLEYNLPICKEAKEQDVVTTCFRELPCLSFYQVHTRDIGRIRGGALGGLFLVGILVG